MTREQMVLPALVIAANALLAGSAIWNRSSGIQTVELTEAELPFHRRGADRSLLMLRLSAEYAVTPPKRDAGRYVPRKEYAVLEITTPVKPGASRLRVIETGPDDDALRQRYADRSRYVIALLPWQYNIAVPAHVARSFEGLTPWLHPEEPPRYAVTLHIGRRYEPWISSVRRLR